MSIYTTKRCTPRGHQSLLNPLSTPPLRLFLSSLVFSSGINSEKYLAPRFPRVSYHQSDSVPDKLRFKHKFKDKRALRNFLYTSRGRVVLDFSPVRRAIIESSRRLILLPCSPQRPRFVLWEESESCRINVRGISVLKPLYSRIHCDQHCGLRENLKGGFHYLPSNVRFMHIEWLGGSWANGGHRRSQAELHTSSES